MRNMRSAWWALGLAGAAYLWRNRGRMQQQFGQLNQNFNRRPLPDYGHSGTQQPNQQQDQSWERPSERQFGGTDV